jgi:hypothetical protein
LMRRLLRRVRRGGQRQQQAGGDKCCDAFHVRSPLTEGIEAAPLG